MASNKSVPLNTQVKAAWDTWNTKGVITDNDLALLQRTYAQFSDLFNIFGEPKGGIVSEAIFNQKTRIDDLVERRGQSRRKSGFNVRL